MAGVQRYSSHLVNAITRPVEFLDRVAVKVDQGRGSQLVTPEIAPTHNDHVVAAHEILGTAACSECSQALAGVRASVTARLANLSYQDAGPALAELLWVLVRHMRPERVVETGVARGVSSAFTLDALARNGMGHLWSIDLPPLGGDWRSQIGIAVAPEMRSRWTYIRGASRRVLPSLLAQLGSIELFTHDGLHTKKNQEFEYRTAWPYLKDGGAVISDDVDFSDAFVTFAEDVGQIPVLVCEAAKRGVVGLLRREH